MGVFKFQNGAIPSTTQSTQVPTTSNTMIPTQPENATKTTNTAIMVGIGVGASVCSIFLTIIGIYIFKLYKKKRNRILRII
jgi:hypothetical protein